MERPTLADQRRRMGGFVFTKWVAEQIGQVGFVPKRVLKMGSRLMITRLLHEVPVPIISP